MDIDIYETKRRRKSERKRKILLDAKKDLAIYIPLENFRHKYSNCTIVSVH